MNINDRVRVADDDNAEHPHQGKEGTVIGLIGYDEPGIAEMGTPPENSTTFVVVQLDDPGFDPVSDEELLFAKILQGVPDVLVNAMKENRQATIFDDGQLELVTA